MTRLRIVIWLMTALFIAMMFIPLVTEMFQRLGRSVEVTP